MTSTDCTSMVVWGWVKHRKKYNSDRHVACCRALPEALVSPLADNALIKTIPLEHFPRDLFMIGRSIMLLRGLTHALGMDVQVMHNCGCHAWSFECMSDVFGVNMQPSVYKHLIQSEPPVCSCRLHAYSFAE